MSIAQTVTRHLPYLRRYARALTGSQAAGDAYVAATLEAIIADRAAFEAKLLTRPLLFQFFTKIWNSVPVNGVAEPTPKGIPAERRLSHITPLPRQAFLLIALEGFSESMRPRSSISRCRKSAHWSKSPAANSPPTSPPMSSSSRTRHLSRSTWKGWWKSRAPGHRHCPHAPGSPRPRARETARTDFAHIQLADGSSGIDAVNDLLESFEIPVIFITAYPERFLTGERPEPAFLIAKPYQPATVSAVLSQALFFERKATRRERRAMA